MTKFQTDSNEESESESHSTGPRYTLIGCLAVCGSDRLGSPEMNAGETQHSCHVTNTVILFLEENDWTQVIFEAVGRV